VNPRYRRMVATGILILLIAIVVVGTFHRG
jgi:hypothetical protein